MSLEVAIIIALGALLVGQQVFWLINIQKLVNKAMSRDFSEYVHGQVVLSHTPAQKKENEQDTVVNDDFSVEQANRANDMFGFSKVGSEI